MMGDRDPIKFAVHRSRVSGLWMVVAFLALVLTLAAFDRAHAAECGGASWYGYTGSRTANGERYNGSGMTAAHKSLPFGTIVRVTDQVLGKSIDVRINDRGPYVRGRIIDLSREAGGHFNLTHPAHGRGVTKVCIKILRKPP